MEKEVDLLRKSTSKRQKKEIFEILNEKKMNETFTEWYKEIEITVDNMKIAMEHNLSKAIIHILKTKIECLGANNSNNIPFACFKEKPNMIFIYDKNETDDYNDNINGDNKPKWKIGINNDIEKMVKYLSHEILKVFVKWQRENIDFFMANEQNKNLEIEYMSRISGHNNSLDRRTQEIKKGILRFMELTFS